MEHFFVQNRWVDPSQNFLGWSPMPLILARQLLFASNVRPRELHSLLLGQLSRLLEVGKETLTMFSSCWRVVLPLHRCELNFCRWLLSVPLRGRPYQPTGHFSHKPPLEPVGGSSPKFSGSSILSSFVGKTSHPQTLACPAQGSPIPAFRFPHNNICLQRASGWVGSETDRGSSARLHRCLSCETNCTVVSCPRVPCPSF